MSTKSSAPQPPSPPNPLHVLTLIPRDYLINLQHLTNLAQDFYGRILSGKPAPEESVEIFFYDESNALSHKDLFFDTLVRGFGRRDDNGESAELAEPPATTS